MFVSIALLIGGLTILTFGAEGLVRAGASLALRLGVTPLVIGLTIIAWGTGSPEIVICSEAALKENSAIALGNIIGSNIGNIALVLGVAGLIFPIQAQAAVVRREMPIMVGVTVLLWALIADGRLGRLDGLVLLLGSFAYTIFVYLIARRDKSKLVTDEFSEAVGKPTRSAWLDAAMLLGGLAFLVGGAKLFVEGALAIAAYFKISQVVIGLTVVAIGTSLPELATSIVAARKREPDVALGNAIGSNIMNVTFILGVTALIQPISASEIKTTDLCVMLGCALLLWALLHFRKALDRTGSAFLLLGYAVYMVSLVR